MPAWRVDKGATNQMAYQPQPLPTNLLYYITYQPSETDPNPKRLQPSCK